MIAVVFNPSAQGDKARAFLRQLEDLPRDHRLLPTRWAGDAVVLAKQAVEEGATTVVAAGGDGTVNEVLNGLILAVSEGELPRFAVLPLGTVNVFARELGIPAALDAAWDVVQTGQEQRVDLACACWEGNRRWFVQLAGAGLDAQAIARVRWNLKRRVGKLAYVWAGLEALRQRRSRIEVRMPNETLVGELVLIGNGRLYGGNFSFFPQANLCDGLLDVLVIPRIHWVTLVRLGLAAAKGRMPPPTLAHSRQVNRFELTAEQETPFQVEGDIVGTLPASFQVGERQIRVLVPKALQ